MTNETSFADHPLTTAHSDRIKALCATIPNVRTKGFMKAVRALDAEYTAEMFTDRKWAASVAFVPDAYEIDHGEQVARVFEVVETHDISIAKFEKMAELAFVLDEDYWTLELVRFDRFGHRIFNIVNAHTMSVITKDPWHLFSTEHVEQFDYSDFIAEGLNNGIDKAVASVMVLP